MTSLPNTASLLSRLHDFTRAQSAMAAVEFAALLPFMLTLYIGGFEVADGVAINRKVTITTRAVADLASRYTNINNTDMANILGASSQIIAPYPSNNLAVTVSQVAIDAKGNAAISWSDSLGGTAHTVGEAVTLTGTLATKNTSLIWGEVKYSYTPTLGYMLTGTWPLSGSIFMSPRNSNSIARCPPTC
jgi:Flp pilus assembly protein TadG